MGSARLRLSNRNYTIYVNRGTINGKGGYEMTEFMKVDYFAEIADAVINDLHRRSLRGNENDATIIKATYTTYLLSNYAESFWLDKSAVAALTVNDDGSAESDSRQLTGAPSLAEFIEYVRQGR